MKMIEGRLGFLFSLFLGLFLCVFVSAADSAVLHVKPSGNDGNNGLSWALAKQTVQAAINAANQGDEIWVAAGTYAEHIKNKTAGPSGSEVAVDTALYGGFAGTETSRDQRNWQTNYTFLNGGSATGPTVNGSVIIIDSSATQETRIDGFVITGGHGIAAGGIFIGGSGPVIANNTITQNFSNVGGGILISNYKITPPQVHPVITNNTINNNYAIEAGGGIVVVGSERLVTFNPVAPLISRNNIYRNVSAFHGGGIGIYGHAAPQITNNYIFSNTAAYDEANYMGNGGGIYATSRDVTDEPLQFTVCAPVIISNVIAANGANFGGGIHLWDTDVEHGGIPVVTNNSVFGNSGTGISWITTNPMIQNNLIAFNSRGLEQGDAQSTPQALRNNCVYGNELWEENTNYNGLADQTGINGNISADPKMANYKIGNFHLQTGSPCIDAGYSAAIGDGWTDIDGQARIIGNAVDIGADESEGSVGAAPTPIYYVRTSGNDAQNGLSWAAAKKTVSGAIAVAQTTGGEIWVAAGTYGERNILPAFIYLYGGFAGTETNRDSRNINANQSILDGGGGQPTVVNSLYAGYFMSAIDGFTIQNGGLYTGGSVPTGSQGYKGRGAGIYCQVTSPLIQNNTIRHNSLSNPFDDPNKTGYGAGIYTYLSYALIQDNLITENEILSDNSATGSGGGIYFFRSMPTILRNTISNNRAISGAAIYGLHAYPRIIENTIENNSFYNNMPGYYMGASQGAITLAMCWDALIERNRIKGNLAMMTGAMGAGISMSTQFAGRIQNNLILDNYANGMGGGIYAEVPLTATSSLYIVNNTIVGNTGAYGIEQGGGIAVSIPAPIFTPPYPIPDRIIIANNIIAFNSSGIMETLTSPMVPPTMVKNDVYNTGSNYIAISAGATDIHVDPQFVNRSGGNFHLMATSPCIDAGDNGIALLPPTDIEGNPRIQDGNNDGIARIDMGVYESQGGPGRGDELAVDFGGLGIWHYNAGAWNKLSDVGAQFMLNVNGSFIGDFGAAGIWQFNGTSWQQLAVANPDNNGNAMIAYGTGFVADLGGLGLWYYNGTNWSQISAAGTEFMVVYNNNLLVGDFGAAGIWQFNGTSWQQLAVANPDNNGNAMVAYGTGIVIDFGASGLWYYNGTNWSQIAAAGTEFMVVYNNNLLVDDFGAAGIWQFNGTSWQQLAVANPDNNGNAMIAYGTGFVADLGGLGLWYYNGTNWSQLSGLGTEVMAVYGNFLVGDFGAAGVWQFNGTTWTQLSPLNPDNNGNAFVDLNLVN